MAALEHVSRYARPSTLETMEGGERLFLAAAERDQQPALFFHGRLLAPRQAADLLLALSRVVRARFHTPAAMLARILAEADPVVTCAEDRLRLEGFSSCCSAYARVDLLPEAVEGALLGHGTTNVDFNPEMRAALARIGDADAVGLSVGQGEVEMSTPAGVVIERKVPLPLRWLKGFVEATAHQARMTLRFEVGAGETRRFLRSLPRGAAKAAYLVETGGSLRLAQGTHRDAVRLAGVERLRVLEDLARHARGLRVYAGDDTEATAWELVLPGARFVVALSPEVWRGFSGEGQVLSRLGDRTGAARAPLVRRHLRWQGVIDAYALAADCGLSPRETQAALAHLGAMGIVGYDLARQAYFHRELPYNLEQIERLNPRLREARALVHRGGVRIDAADGELITAWVAGTGVEHHVRLHRGGERCTCPWFAKHGGDRGPCKHVLAVQLLALGESDDP